MRNIAVERARLGIKQSELAEAIGAFGAQVSTWETGKVDPSASTLIKIAEYFGCSVDYLLGLVEERHGFR